jgi:hypothetical protein
MATQFLDIYMRDYVGDSGQVPSDLRQGVSQSPDIIPSGSVAPDSNYRTTFAANYSGPYNYFQEINSSEYNYIYVRGFNAFPKNQSGSINLYWAPASLLLYPPNWINNKIANTNGTFSATLSDTPTGQVCVGQGAFFWRPSGIATGDHYCLIAQVVTGDHPNPLPGLIPGAAGSDIEAFAAWVADNADIAWRNVSTIQTPTNQFSAFVMLVNPSSTRPGLFTLAVTCTEIPDGTDIALTGSEPTPALNLAFTVGPDNLISDPGAEPKVNSSGITVNVPAGYTEAVRLTATAPEKFPFGSSIRPALLLLLASDHALASRGLRPSELNVEGADDDSVMVPLGDYTFQF